MIDGQTPRWLQYCERKFGWLAIPNISILLITLQAFGFLIARAPNADVGSLALVPSLVADGEVWRLITFLAMPLSTSFLIIIVLWFLYFILNLLESEWGAFKTTFYVLISMALMITYSFIFQYPIWDVRHFQSTLFLAAAALYPDFEILLFFVLPVKMKWMAWITAAFIFVEFVSSSEFGKILLLAVYSNYLLFFGPYHWRQGKNIYRRWKMKDRFK
jgi:hypothetical protein